MEINLKEKISKKKKNYLLDDNNIKSADIIKERIDYHDKARKNKINKKIFNKESNSKDENKNNSSYENNYDLNISNLNIDPELKTEVNLKNILYDNNIDRIIECINMRNNIDYIKFGLYLLNEKLSLNIIKDINALNNINFKEIVFSLLIYSKEESTKLYFDPIIIILIYDLIMNYININNNDLDISYLCNEKFLELHLYFIDSISDIVIINNILRCIVKMASNINEKVICKIFEYNGEIFFNKLTEIINDFQNNNELCEIILKLFIQYINAFNNFEKIKEKKSKEIEMKDNTYYPNNYIIENIFNISLILIFNKQFDDSLYLISNILKILHKTKNFELFEKLISNKNISLMLNFILERDYSNFVNNIMFMADIVKYIIKLGFNSNFIDIKELIGEIEKNMNENENILNIFINLLLNQEFKLKEKINLKLIEALFVIIKNESFIKNISNEDKYCIYEIIIKFIQSSNYKIRKKIFKILEKITNKKDYRQADFLIKNKILYHIKQAIDPSITYCNDEKVILIALNLIDNFLALGDSIAILNGVNTVLIEFENIGGKEMLENLLCNKSEMVFNYSSDLIDKYFK